MLTLSETCPRLSSGAVKVRWRRNLDHLAGAACRPAARSASGRGLLGPGVQAGQREIISVWALFSMRGAAGAGGAQSPHSDQLCRDGWGAPGVQPELSAPQPGAKAVLLGCFKPTGPMADTQMGVETGEKLLSGQLGKVQRPGLPIPTSPPSSTALASSSWPSVQHGSRLPSPRCVPGAGPGS